MSESAEQIRRTDNVIRLGTIAEVNHATARVRVKSGGNDSNWLAWLSLRAGTTREWNPPTAGEQCLVLSPGGEMAAGIVLLGIFSDAIPAPSASPDEHLREYPDGARILYNHATGALSATGIKTALVEASEKCTVDCPESEFTGNVLVRGTLTYLDGLNNAGTGTGATISGPIDHNGELTNTGSISSNGVVLATHRHPDADGGTTGAPL
ncbi:phage baseplate assembly protein V [Vogesella indigofera]|uniref:phage baseplate assembly protein V n=1 Tax=Vogesella indigofera TaxID=45465 RepID=UPI00234EBE57|nr:phage baseplate assembly protein V [Vogesella indigofera]MDC7699591.1 phage baseplate assembly protein V [Vogesella indigofera]